MPTRTTVTPFAPTPSPMDIDSAVREQIATRAFALFLERGREDGHDLDDWLQAEREIMRSAGVAVGQFA